jgi:hypothetical protein
MPLENKDRDIIFLQNRIYLNISTSFKILIRRGGPNPKFQLNFRALEFGIFDLVLMV